MRDVQAEEGVFRESAESETKRRWLRLDRSPPGVTRSPRRLSGVPRPAGAGAGGPDPRDRAWRAVSHAR
ncbi:hypothetical protein NDU88_005123 [Pleurodeles waltl]|uniref:Uncharacterized protein n=1 Tax=Pleurodeles waltl TaxID=8319 RepID=A0AAV7TTD0_PLEWA|nr:hypothetical protein NDU88_005123 [Pleurodeles waltl]